MIVCVRKTCIRSFNSLTRKTQRREVQLLQNKVIKVNIKQSSSWKLESLKDYIQKTTIFNTLTADNFTVLSVEKRLVSYIQQV